MMRSLALALSAVAVSAEPQESAFTAEKVDGGVVVKGQGREVLRYVTQRPAGSKLSVESACYFHPLATPKGMVITDVAPGDHPHHRGIFLAFVEMHGKKDADFWGWGQHAPKDGRKIVNREVKDLAGGSFRARNEWLAEETAVLTESLQATVSSRPSAHVVDLVYSLVAEEETTLSRWGFSGFCVRTRKDGKIEAEGPEGPANFPAPNHMKPESGWPAAAWYAYTIRLKDGGVGGAAVIGHPKNPPALWHNAVSVGMLNPSVVAPAKIVLKAKKSLTLGYRVVAYDGEAPRELLKQLSDEWAKREIWMFHLDERDPDRY
jgi:hypothetical protein